MKKYFEIKIENQKVLIEGTPEAQNLIRDMNILDASIDNLTSFLNQNNYNAEKSVKEIEMIRKGIEKKIDEEFIKLIIIKQKLKDKIYDNKEKNRNEI